MELTPGSPTARLLDAALLLAPLAYLLLDCTYAVRGWWDGPTGAAHVVVAALYGVAALRLVLMASGRLQAVMLAVTLLGVVGNAGVGQDTVAVSLGGLDLFLADGPAVVFKAMGFFFPLTLLLGAVALRGAAAGWVPVAVAVGAVLFPIAHVGNISWLAIADAVLLAFAFGHLHATLRRGRVAVSTGAQPGARVAS